MCIHLLQTGSWKTDKFDNRANRLFCCKDYLEFKIISDTGQISSVFKQPAIRVSSDPWCLSAVINSRWRLWEISFLCVHIMQNSYFDLSPKQWASFIASAPPDGEWVWRRSKLHSNLPSWHLSMICVYDNHVMHFNALFHYKQGNKRRGLQCFCKNQVDSRSLQYWLPIFM